MLHQNIERKKKRREILTGLVRHIAPSTSAVFRDKSPVVSPTGSPSDEGSAAYIGFYRTNLPVHL